MKISLSQFMVWIIIFVFGLNFLNEITGIYIDAAVYFVIAFVYMIYNNIKTDQRFVKNILFVLFFVAYGLLLLIFNDSGIGSIYTAVTGITVMFAFQEVEFTKAQKYAIFIILLVGNVYWSYMSDGWYEKYLEVLRAKQSIVNPNGVGYFILFSYVFMYILLWKRKELLFRVFKLLAALWSIKGIFNVHARMALGMFVLFFLMIFFVFKIKKIIVRQKFLKFAFVMSIVIEMLFPVIYIAMYKAGFGRNYLYMGVVEKGLYSGRQIIWLNAFKGMKTMKDWIIGVGSRVDYWTGHDLNMHNNALHLLVVFGIVGLIGYFAFLLHVVFKYFNFEKASKIQILLLCFFIIIMFGGSSDIMLFYNDFMLLVFVPLGIALNKKYQMDK